MAFELVVEDGSIVAGANTYVSDQDVRDFCYARNYPLPDDADLKNLIIISMDNIENKNFSGVPVSSEQELKFPRSGITIDSIPLPDTTIPKVLKDAVSLQVYLRYNDLWTTDATFQSIKKKKIDVIETEYFSSSEGGSTASSTESQLEYMLRDITSGMGSGVFRVSRII